MLQCVLQYSTVLSLDYKFLRHPAYMINQSQIFTGVRGVVFPIANWELRKFLPLAVMMFITVFNFTLLRNAKDALFVTAPGSGAESITFLKLYGVLPMMVLASLVYVKIRKKLNFERSYYVIIAFFMCFFILFICVLYPLRDELNMSAASIIYLKESYPRFQHFFPAIGLWVYSLFYVFAELWGTFTLSVLFWQFANDNIGPSEAKRYYPLLIFVNSMATMTLGYVMSKFADFPPEKIVVNSTLLLIALVVCLFATFRWMHVSVLSRPQFTQYVSQRTKKPKVKISFVESIKQALKSPYIGYIVILVLSYNIMTNIMEVTWKSQALRLFNDLQSYYRFMSTYTFWTGVITMLFIFISQSLLRLCGWCVCAMITPVIASFIGVVFFSYMLFQDQFAYLLRYFGGITPLVFIVWFGGIGVLIGKSSKYSFFDPTKEMAFIPLSYDLRMTGKAAVDGVGARLGKSSGGFIQTVLYVFTAGSQIDIAPYLAGIIVLLGVLWLVAVLRLNKLYHHQVELSQS